MPAAAGDTFLQAMRNVYAMAAPPAGITSMPTLWLDEAPEGEGYPRAVIEHEGETPIPDSFDDQNNGVASFNEAIVTFHLFAENNSDTCEALATSVMSAASPDSINLSFDQTAVIFRLQYVVKKDRTRSSVDKPVYVASIRYKGQFGTNY